MTSPIQPSSGKNADKINPNKALEPELFLFKGITVRDLWLQPKLTWNVIPSLSASLRADFLIAPADLGTETFLPGLDTQDRILLWCTYRL